MIACTSGWFWQAVPIRFQRNAIASSRSTSTPRLASHKMISANSASTAGFDQSRSHCHSLNVVQTQRVEVGVAGEVARARSPGRPRAASARRRRGARGRGRRGSSRRYAASPARARDRPGVLAGHVVEHQVHDQADPAAAQGGRQVAQVVDRAEVGTHRAVVLHRVPAVVVALARLQQRHQVEVGDAEVLEVVEVVGDARERHRRSGRCSRRSRTSAGCWSQSGCSSRWWSSRCRSSGRSAYAVAASTTSRSSSGAGRRSGRGGRRRRRRAGRARSGRAGARTCHAGRRARPTTASRWDAATAWISVGALIERHCARVRGRPLRGARGRDALRRTGWAGRRAAGRGAPAPGRAACARPAPRSGWRRPP